MASFSDSSRSALLLLCAFGCLAFAIYQPALHAPFHSDDFLFIGTNPWTATMNGETLRGIFDPAGDARFYVGNYAPLHLLATALEIQAFGEDPFGYHVVNVLLHTANACLLSVLLFVSGLPAVGAAFGGLLFLVHPANVEAVAWVSQLKTNGALTLSLLAVIAFRRRPALATGLFVAALLTKAHAVFAGPLVGALAWARGELKAPSRTAAWLATWGVLFALYLIPQLSAFGPHGGVDVPAYEDRGVHLRTMASIGLRYLVMAATSLGVAHAPEHPPVESFWDPWWLASLPVVGLLLWRVIVTLRRRSAEAAFWIGAAAAFGPVSQWFPFSHPMADRYLYFMLPGLLGGSLFLLHDRVVSRSERPVPVAVTYALAAIGLVLVSSFGVQARERSALWADPIRLALDSAEQFPNGRTAAYLAAQHASERGDVTTAVAKLREAARLGRDGYEPLLVDPVFRSLYGNPGFQAHIDALALGKIERFTEPGQRLSQNDHAQLAAAYAMRGQLAEAKHALRTGIARGGLLTPVLEAELASMRQFELQRDATSSP